MGFYLLGSGFITPLKATCGLKFVVSQSAFTKVYTVSFAAFVGSSEVL
jgi:hypothetical protein